MARKTIRSIKQRVAILSLLLGLIACKPPKEFQPKVGDLLFQDIDCGPICEAIETVTKGYRNADFSHVGIIDTLQGEWMVLEAISAGVTHTPLNDFLARSADSLGKPKVIVGRLKPELQQFLPTILAKARSYIGNGYDAIYTMNDSVYYCSELVFEAYMADTMHLFSLAPMTFKSLGDASFFPSWVRYYQSMNCEIPEGKPGINPGLISRSENIAIVHIYGYPEGFEE